MNRGPSDLRNEFYALPPVARFERITVQRARKPFSACAAPERPLPDARREISGSAKGK